MLVLRSYLFAQASVSFLHTVGDTCSFELTDVSVGTTAGRALVGNVGNAQLKVHGVLSTVALWAQALERLSAQRGGDSREVVPHSHSLRAPRTCCPLRAGRGLYSRRRVHCVAGCRSHVALCPVGGGALQTPPAMVRKFPPQDFLEESY